MRLVFDNEVKSDERFLGRELARRLDADYRVFPDDPVDRVPDGVNALVLAGSSAGVYEDREWIPTAETLVRDAVERGVPTLAVCFGHQLVTQALGGRVEPMERTHAGLVELRDYDASSGLFEGVEPRVPALNGDAVTALGDGLTPIARADHDPHFATRHDAAPLWTVQFHPECRPRHAERYDDWDESREAWTGTNAHRVLENFATLADPTGQNPKK